MSGEHRRGEAPHDGVTKQGRTGEFLMCAKSYQIWHDIECTNTIQAALFPMF